MNKQAFTLVEVLITISIIALILTTVIYGYSRVMKNSRDTKRRLDIAEIAHALEKYKKDKGEYPATLTQLTTPDTYLKKIPKDPLPAYTYEYNVNADLSSYVISASLELTNSYFMITPQGKRTADAIATLAPIQTTDDDPTFPTNNPTVVFTSTPAIEHPTWYYE